jgi:hypothetical protein
VRPVDAQPREQANVSGMNGALGHCVPKRHRKQTQILAISAANRYVTIRQPRTLRMSPGYLQPPRR